MPIPAILPVLGAVAARLTPMVVALRSALPALEYKFNPVGLIVAGGVGYAVNEFNQQKADVRHQEALAAIRDVVTSQEARLKALEAGNQAVLDAVHIGDARLSRQVSGVSDAVGGVESQFHEARQVITAIKRDVAKADKKIAMCMRPDMAQPQIPELTPR